MHRSDSARLLLEAALECASRGWHVFPCHTIVDGTCSCGHADCENAGKHPKTRHGLKDATVDRSQIERWWRHNERVPSNLAIATGMQSKLVVIDVDPRNGGDETLAALEAELGPLPRICTVRTGGGGIHIYLRHPCDDRMPSRNGWRKGIDIKADGGYVIAPPSVHKDGRCYEWNSH
jgi:putative DNA primase/helicase